MADNRSSSKQKRAKQNRAQREALQARTAAASTPAEVRRAKYASSTPEGGGAAAKPAKKGGFFSGGADRPERPPRPGETPVDIESLEGSWFSIRMKIPGCRQVMTGAGLLVLVTILAFFVNLPAVKATKGQKALPSETIIQRAGPQIILVLLVPLALGAISLIFATSPRRRRYWMWTAMISFAVSLLGLSWYLFPAGFFAFGVYKAYKVEGPAPYSRAGRAAARAAETADSSSTDLDDDLEGSAADDE